MKEYEDLANAIIVQAVKDYRKILQALEKDPLNTQATYCKRELEKFFHSKWYRTLTNLDGNVLLDKLRKETA
jgi:hypothetical protein